MDRSADGPVRNLAGQGVEQGYRDLVSSRLHQQLGVNTEVFALRLLVTGCRHPDFVRLADQVGTFAFGVPSGDEQHDSSYKIVSLGEEREAFERKRVVGGKEPAVLGRCSRRSGLDLESHRVLVDFENQARYHPVLDSGFERFLNETRPVTDFIV